MRCFSNVLERETISISQKKNNTKFTAKTKEGAFTSSHSTLLGRWGTGGNDFCPRILSRWPERGNGQRFCGIGWREL